MWSGRASGTGRAGLADERSGLLRADAVVHRASAGDLVVMKGTEWPGNEARGAVHRSPSWATGGAWCSRDALDAERGWT